MFFSLQVAAGLWHSSGGGRLKRKHGRCMDLAVVDTWLTIATSSRHLGCSGSMAARKPHTWRGGRASTQTPGSGRSWSSGPSSGTQVGLLDPAAWRRLGWHCLGSGLGLGFGPGHSCRGGRLGLPGATLVHLALLGHVGLGRGLAHGGDWGAGQKDG